VRRFYARLKEATRPIRPRWRQVTAPLRERINVRRELARLGEPVSFQEKVRYKMLADRRPLLTTFADKLAVRDYVASKVGAGILTDLYLVTDDPGVLATAELPREHVIKPTHASGACVVVADFAPPEAALPGSPNGFSGQLVQPGNLSTDRLIDLCEHWLARGYRLHEEWCYRNVPRRIIVEELLGGGGGVPYDIKFSVFHGRVRLIQVELGRFDGHARNFYSPEWERLDVSVRKYPPGTDVARPAALDEMLRIAELLGGDTDFVRVDLYCIGPRIVFGELTNYPETGRMEFVPPEFDRELGRWWTPPKRYR
jgi:hypothetical protein